MPTILGANSVRDTGYNVDNSLRFNDGDSASLSRTPSSTGSQQIGTWSYWIKRADVTAYGLLYSIQHSGEHFEIWIAGDVNDNTIEIRHYNGSSYDMRLITNRKFRDVSAWYHIVVALDTTQGTDSNRIKLYINGVQETSFSTATYPSQNDNFVFSQTSATKIGTRYNDSNFFDGYMAEVVFIDGQQLDPTSFGEFNEDSPTIWQPIDVSGLTFGTNGFHLDFEDSSALGNDVSGNNNDFTPSNLAATDQSTDTCTNNFATLNPLNVPTSNAPTFSEGNLISSTSDSAKFGGTSTIGVSSGKWYAEFKSAETGGEEKEMVGVTHSPAEDARNGNNVGRSAGSFAIRFLDGQQSNNNSASDYGSAFSVGDICQVALDVDNNQLYFGKNGQWGDGSGNFNQSTPTSAITITTIANSTEGAYFFSVGDLSSSSGRSLISCNFGSPPFAISSGNADGEGFGNFEYAVPSGYFALCSKNLSEYGG